MIGLKAKQKRFSLYFLEENEVYTQDLTCYFTILDIPTQKESKEKGKLHICSRSLIFEPDDPTLSITKYFYKYMAARPTKDEDNTNSLKETKRKLFDPKISAERILFKTHRFIEISTTGPPKPYVQHENIILEVGIIPIFEKIVSIIDWIDNLSDLALRNEPGFDADTEINRLIMLRNKGKIKFDMSQLESVTEKVLMVNPLLCKRVRPLVTIYGLVYITNKNIYFQTMHSVSAKPVKKICLESIKKLYRRRFELKQIGLELSIFDERNLEKSYFFSFETPDEREEVYKAIFNNLKNDFITETTLEKLTQKWQNKEISNYEYLLSLNEAAYRSFSDITQYPVFPWVIQDYDSSELDLQDRKIYRDLSKPMGALNSKRLSDFKQRYHEMDNPKFLYGTHYSTPGYVIGYLLRKRPLYMLKLQSGKFDKPDRLFYSIKKDWENVYNNPANVKELIPEFYGNDTNFLENELKLNLGLRQNEKKVDNVKLPKWAKNAKEYLEINRKALESDYVSNNLNQWIDLIFGYKQKGPQAVDANNVFHYLTYEGMVDLEKIEDPVERKAMRVQINEFGQTPKQLFKIPHPPRVSIVISVVKEINASQKEETHSSEEKKEFASNLDTIPKMINEKKDFKYVTIPKVHKNQISHIHFLSESKILTVGYDGFIKVVDIEEKMTLKSFKLCDFVLSCSQQIHNQEIFALGSWNNKIYLFNLNYGNKIDVIDAHHDAVSSLFYLPKKNCLISGSWDCTLKLWKLKNNYYFDKNHDEVLIDHENQITNLAVNKEETLLVFGDVEGQVKIVDLLKKCIKVSLKFPSGQKNIQSIFVENNIISAGENIVKLYDKNGLDLSTYQIEQENGNLVDVGIEQSYLIIGTDRGNVSVFDMLLDKKIGFLYFDFYTNQDSHLYDNEDFKFSSLSIHPSGKTLVLASQTGCINVVKL